MTQAYRTEHARRIAILFSVGLDLRMDWTDIDLFPRAAYEIDIEWRDMERHLEQEIQHGLDLDPDFQRLHVWTEAQRTAYLEYVLRGGEVGRNLTIACSDWHSTPTPDYVLVDGKQRLETVRKFLRGEVPAFGHLYSQFTGSLRFVQARFKWRVVECKTRQDILRLYLNINAGGTPHTAEEIAKAQALLAALNTRSG